MADYYKLVQWNLVIKRSDITKPWSPALYFFVFYPDIMRNLI